MKTAYARLPGDVASNCMMITAFLLLGAVFCIVFEPGRRFSPRAIADFVLQRDLLRRPTSRVDILHFVLTTGLWLPVTGALVTTFLTLNVRDVLTAHLGGRAALLQAGWALALLQFAVLFASRDLGTYVGHRLLHKVPLLWSIHRSHHSAEVLTFLTSARAHPLESLHMQSFIIAFGAVGGGIFLYFTGTTLQPAPLLLLVGTSIFFETFGLAQHSHIPISFGPFNYLLTSPVMHQLHHSAETRHRDRNFAAQLALFDWLFGTLYIPRKGETYRLGLNDEEMGENNPHVRLRDFYFEPIRHAWRLLTR